MLHLRPSGSVCCSFDRTTQRARLASRTAHSAKLTHTGGRQTICLAFGRGKDMTSQTTEQQLVRLQQQLLDSIVNRDWATYADLCDDTLTAFEPEAVGHLVEGLPFHKFYFDLLAARENYKPPANTISQPHVRLIGDNAAVVSYIRLQQKIDAVGRPLTIATEETRVWEKKGGKWRNVHFHRSPTTPSS